LATGVKTATGTNSRKGVYVKSTQGYAQAYLGSLSLPTVKRLPPGRCELSEALDEKALCLAGALRNRTMCMIRACAAGRLLPVRR
jgi:hypothetical protein